MEKLNTQPIGSGFHQHTRFALVSGGHYWFNPVGGATAKLMTE